MISLILVSLLIILQGFFAGIETGFVSLDRVRLKFSKIIKGHKISLINTYISHPDKFLTTTLLGTNITNILAATIFTTYILHRFPESGDLISSIILVPVTLIFSEIIPKSIFREYPNRLTPNSIFVFHIFHKLFSIPTQLLSAVSNYLVDKVSKRRKKKNPFLTKDELLLLTKRQEISQDNFTYETAKKIFIFGEKQISDILIPVTRMLGIDMKWEMNKIRAEFESSGLNYLPVYEKSKFNIIGILHSKDLLFSSDVSELKERLLKIETIDYDINLKKALTKFQMRGVPLMAVKYEDRIIGIVTLRDIIKQLF